MGKKRIIAETGAGQHGVATATVCARLGLECIIYMGAKDMERQSLNVFRMRLMGAEVRPVTYGTATLKDATSEAIRDWVTNVETTHYILGSAAGPHPYPMMVRDFQSVIGRETRRQCMDKWGGLPDIVLACVGGGSNAMGIFHEFVDEQEVRLIGWRRLGMVSTLRSMRRRSQRAAQACCMAASHTCCRMRRGRSSTHTPSVQVLTTQASAQSTPSLRTGAAQSTLQ